MADQLVDMMCDEGGPAKLVAAQHDEEEDDLLHDPVGKAERPDQHEIQNHEHAAADEPKKLVDAAGQVRPACCSFGRPRLVSCGKLR